MQSSLDPSSLTRSLSPFGTLLIPFEGFQLDPPEADLLLHKSCSLAFVSPLSWTLFNTRRVRSCLCRCSVARIEPSSRFVLTVDWSGSHTAPSSASRPICKHWRSQDHARLFIGSSPSLSSPSTSSLPPFRFLSVMWLGIRPFKIEELPD